MPIIKCDFRIIDGKVDRTIKVDDARIPRWIRDRKIERERRIETGLIVDDRELKVSTTSQSVDAIRDNGINLPPDLSRRF